MFARHSDVAVALRAQTFAETVERSDMRVHNPELISAQLDGELRGVRRWLVQRHLRRCAICAAEYQRVQRVRGLLAANPVTPPMSDSPEFFWSKVKREIETRDRELQV